MIVVVLLFNLFSARLFTICSVMFANSLLSTFSVRKFIDAIFCESIIFIVYISNGNSSMFVDSIKL